MNYFFYDLETSGLNPKTDRIMQFAGIRTDTNFQQIGDPVNLLVKLSDDTLPSPKATMVTGITPQETLGEGLSEPDFCKYVQGEIFTPGTIAIGYNSIRFDDEHMRYAFYRNFYDPYEWQWKDGRGRWDLLDVVRLTRALRPEGINWPFIEKDGETKPVNRLELLTKENNIVHAHAHDALSDVEALISITKLISEKQPRLFQYLFKMRDKNELKKLINLDQKNPFVYASGRYPSGHLHTTVAFPLTAGANGNILVYDLRYNLEELFQAEKDFVPEEKIGKNGEKYQTSWQWSPVVKELCYNKCPAVSPISVLDVEIAKKTGWEKISLDRAIVEKNLETLLKHPEFAERMRSEFGNRRKELEIKNNSTSNNLTTIEQIVKNDVDGKLYDGFIPASDKIKMLDVRTRDGNKLADFHPFFEDVRLQDLLLHYKGRNFPTSLDEKEQAMWQEYRTARLNQQSHTFIIELNELKQLHSKNQPLENGKLVDDFLLDELMLYYQSLAD